jgi:D-alanyl-D-alanine dipeptidase
MKTFFGLTLLFLIFSVHVAHGEPLLKGSPESQVKQNAEADRVQLVRINNDVELEEMKAGGLLVKIPDTPGVRVDERLPEHLRFVRPWVATFLVELGKDFKEHFGEEIQINSAIRTVEYQILISKRNKNAAPVTGAKRSSHLTGAAIDIAKLPLSERQRI